MSQDGITLEEFEAEVLPNAPWSVRIPAAIKKAEAWVEQYGSGDPDWPSATEVALAKAFYEFSAATQMLVNAVDAEPPDVIWAPALIAFTEKVESL